PLLLRVFEPRLVVTLLIPHQTNRQTEVCARAVRCEDCLDCSSRVVAGYAVGAGPTRRDGRRSLRLARPRPRARKTSKACRARTVDESLDAAGNRSLSRRRGRHIAPAPSLVGRLRRLALIGGHAPDALEDRTGHQPAEHADEKADRFVENSCHLGARCPSPEI